MNSYKVSVTLSLDLDSIKDVPTEKIEYFLNKRLNDRQDGRYPFSAEQVRIGLESCIKSAIYEAVEERERKRYAGQVVTRGSGKTARWVYSTARAFRKIIWWIDGHIDARVI